MADANNPPVDKYKLEAPDKALAMKSLSRFLEEGEAEQYWSKACKAADISSETNDLEELSLVFKKLSEEKGAVGVVGKSLTVRCISYRILSKTSK